MSRKSNTAEFHGDWERFANDDPYAYILTELKRLERQDFWQSGHKTVREELLPVITTQGIANRSALEIGCGLGRLVFPLATYFQRVLGVDVAPEMVRRARLFARDNGITNTQFSVISGASDLLNRGELTGNIDFVYSWLVFQHLPNFETITEYLHATAFLLHDDGIALLQFDTRPKSLTYSLKTALPD